VYKRQIEQGAAFVSWSGEVHPCYQLWHSCRSHANSWQHPVQPRVFGSVHQEGLLEIWNGPKFRGYRENVLQRSYPSCSECSLSPCDLVQQQEFSEDCYANQEPCGSCLWRCGVFRCLE
jgi:MoaA/NifB/PqqE/SkfB family radical SAM enzyme